MGVITREDLTETKERFDKDGKSLGSVKETYAKDVEVETFEPLVHNKPEALQIAISAGNVEESSETVEYFMTTGTGKSKVWNKVLRRAMPVYNAKNEIGCLALPAIKGNREKIWQFVSERSNYQGSAGTGEKYGEKSVLGKQDVYAWLRNEGQGPDKAIEKIRERVFNIPGLSDEQKKAAFDAMLLSMGREDLAS